MTLTEIRDLFVAQYKVQAQIRGLPQIEIRNVLIASYISQAQQDIQRRLLVLESKTTITLLASTYEYNLPTDFGRQKNAHIGTTILTEKDGRFIREQIAISSSVGGDWYGIYVVGNTQQLITPKTSGTLTLYYYVDTRYYQPSGSSSQDWGTFDGTAFTGDLVLPDRYDMAVLYNMLSQVIPDYENKYEREIKSLRGSRVSSDNESLSYQFGGVTA